jgi:hypothetical protein
VAGRSSQTARATRRNAELLQSRRGLRIYGSNFWTISGLAPLRFHDMRHLAGTLMSEAGVPPKRAQEILDHADIRTTLAIYTHTMKRRHDDSADRMAALAGLSDLGNKRETMGSVQDEETELSPCSNGSLGWNRTNDQRINSPTLYR